MPPVHRIGDKNSGDGAIDTTPQSFVRVDGKLVAVVGAQGSAHYPCGTTDPDENNHCFHVWKTAVGAPAVRINGKPVIRQYDVDTCTHARAAGSSTTRVGDYGGGAPTGWDEDAWDQGTWDT